MNENRKFYEEYFRNTYNGLNHEVNICIENAHIAANRRGQHFLLEESEEIKSSILPQMVPLSARTTTCQPVGTLLGICTYYTEDGNNIDVVCNFMAYDAIIVSNLYAVKAIEYLHETAFGRTVYYNMYMDRLFTPIPLYDKDPQEFDAKKVGCAGFTRVIPVAEPMEYRLAIEAGLSPSAQSIAECLMRPLPSGKYSKVMNQLGKEYLWNYLNQHFSEKKENSVH